MKLAYLVFLALMFIGTSTSISAPMTGDHVQVAVRWGEGISVFYTGELIDISDGLVCMNCTWSASDPLNSIAIGGWPENITSYECYPSGAKMCFGSGNIIRMTYRGGSDETTIPNQITNQSIRGPTNRSAAA